MKLPIFALVLVLLTVFCVISYAKTQSIQPEPVTDPATLRRLNCQMHCRNELEDDTQDCIYNCISHKCYKKVFKKIINKDTGRISGDISEKLTSKFDQCVAKENDEL